MPRTWSSSGGQASLVVAWRPGRWERRCRGSGLRLSGTTTHPLRHQDVWLARAVGIRDQPDDLEPHAQIETCRVVGHAEVRRMGQHIRKELDAADARASGGTIVIRAEVER